MVLFVALLAPAILAGGLLAGQLTGYDAVTPAAEVPDGAVDRERERVMQARQRAWPGDDAQTAGGGGVLAFEPVLAPAPPHPDATYEGPVPAPPLREVVPERVAVPVPEAPVARPEVDVEERRPGWERPPVRRVGCPGEWAETWLWEMCQEHQRRLA
ncbi:hypothetical protein GCM10010404_27490 [Nonomuraea africana]|uniref:Uncharacterized protein n=1 Tax=Nonomuraea africana TaxID=46171 RepID=A0ABR9KNG0_9ACTN|nr:hypothetical protein [Nonomuraea africana]MBE1563570.1 hypothetical protein [Nonomuraea africana]